MRGGEASAAGQARRKERAAGARGQSGRAGGEAVALAQYSTPRKARGGEQGRGGRARLARLLPIKYEALLLRRDPLLVLDLGLHGEGGARAEAWGGSVGPPAQTAGERKSGRGGGMGGP